MSLLICDRLNIAIWLIFGLFVVALAFYDNGRDIGLLLFEQIDAGTLSQAFSFVSLFAVDDFVNKVLNSGDIRFDKVGDPIYDSVQDE